jgi:preprotein translocase subunit SecG
VLGAGGAQTLAAKATRWVAVLFAVTSIALSVITAHKTRSVVEGMAPILNTTAPLAPVEVAPAATTETKPADAPKK